MKKLVALCLVLLLAAACGVFGIKPEKTAEELAKEGMENLEHGRYSQAIENFEHLRDWYPFSEYAVLAELKLGDAYFRAKRWEEAIFAYQQFESLHPTHEAVPYAVYQMGMAWFEQMRPPDRDQTPASRALEVFQRLTGQHPESPYAVLAAEKSRVCLQHLAKHEISVARFYFRTGKPEAAADRLLAVLANYPDVGTHQEALRYLAKIRQEKAKGKKNEEPSGPLPPTKTPAVPKTPGM
ncbi:MAG: outer membrane protein assembly factor BamD [Deltaproteobacteria bacterium]|nr:outer membrane protein assembly factor BamD [Deltaproteobacteria bacterium]